MIKQSSKDPRNPNLAVLREAVLSKMADSGSCMANSIDMSVALAETAAPASLLLESQDRARDMVFATDILPSKASQRARNVISASNN
mmetsp:Transcript_47632/g.113409  ORF Transcript_47632/g.113409 Transcript_47632/m.113409 type:complete len:87 (-) Transcript_47632:2-262(-)